MLTLPVCLSRAKACVLSIRHLKHYRHECCVACNLNAHTMMLGIQFLLTKAETKQGDAKEIFPFDNTDLGSSR